MLGGKKRKTVPSDTHTHTPTPHTRTLSSVFKSVMGLLYSGGNWNQKIKANSYLQYLLNSFSFSLFFFFFKGEMMGQRLEKMVGLKLPMSKKQARPTFFCVFHLQSQRAPSSWSVVLPHNLNISIPEATLVLSSLW